MDVTREWISRVLEMREMLLSFQTGFNLVNAAVVCAILESSSGLEPSSDTTEPRYLKLLSVSSFCPFMLISGVVCHQLGLLGTDLHAAGCGSFCRDAQLIFPVLLPLMLSHRCHQSLAVKLVMMMLVLCLSLLLAISHCTANG